MVTELGKQVNPGQKSHFSLTSFRFSRPAQNFVAYTKAKETFVTESETEIKSKVEKEATTIRKTKT